MSAFRQFLAALALPAVFGAALALTWAVGGVRGAAFALFLNAFLMSQVAGLFQVWDFRLPETYYHHRAFERSGRICRLVGIRWFQRLMRSALYRRINPNFVARGRDPTGLLSLEQIMRSAETAHLILFWVVAALSSLPLAKGWYDAAGWWMFFNLLFNGYPVLLQRYNRARIQGVLARYN